MNRAKEFLYRYRIASTAGFVLFVTFLAGMLVMASFEEPTTQYDPNDANKDGVVDLADFSVAVDQLTRIMRELGGEEMPCITQCPAGLVETPDMYEEPRMPVPLYK